MCSLTLAAARQIGAANASGENLALRIAARVGADGSLSYGMGFDNAKNPGACSSGCKRLWH
ncbi:MAG: hypothetical protein WCH44_03730 [Betaproteobacteria bacterium]